MQIGKKCRHSRPYVHSCFDFVLTSTLTTFVNFISVKGNVSLPRLLLPLFSLFQALNLAFRSNFSTCPYSSQDNIIVSFELETLPSCHRSRNNPHVTQQFLFCPKFYCVYKKNAQVALFARLNQSIRKSLSKPLVIPFLFMRFHNSLNKRQQVVT